MDVGSAGADMPTVGVETTSDVEEVLSRMTLTEKQEERMRIWLSQKQRVRSNGDSLDLLVTGIICADWQTE